MTTSPEASSTVTTGWVRSAVPPVELHGWVVKTSWVAAPATVNVALVAVLSPVAAADRVKLPESRVILHPAKVATPLAAVTGLVVHVSVPDPVAIARVTGGARRHDVARVVLDLDDRLGAERRAARRVGGLRRERPAGTAPGDR